MSFFVKFILIYKFIFSLIFSFNLAFIIFSVTFKELANPIESVDPWLLITGLFKPNNMAPLYNLGSNFFLKLFKLCLFIIADNLPKIDLVNAFLSS